MKKIALQWLFVKKMQKKKKTPTNLVIGRQENGWDYTGSSGPQATLAPLECHK